MILFELFYEFLIIGFLIFGGGLAAIPFLQQLSVRTGWFTTEQLVNMIAVSEATPGPIGINMATYVGYSVAGFPGAVVASASLILPSICIALFVARLLARFKENRFVIGAFNGLRPASLALIAAAGVAVLRLSLLRLDVWADTGALLDLFNVKAIALAVILFTVTRIFKKIPMAVLIAGSAIVGVLVF